MAEVLLQHWNDSVYAVFEILDVPLIVFKDTVYDTFDNSWIAMAVDSDNIVKLGDVKEPIVINEFLIYFQREMLCLTLLRPAHPVEHFEYSWQ